MRISITRRQGFTLVELLVVVAIIGILIGMLLPAIQQVRESARRTSCQNYLKQLALACLNYESARSKFPNGELLYDNPGTPGRTHHLQGSSWYVQLMPYLELQNFLSRVNFQFRYDGSAPQQFVQVGGVGDIYDSDGDGYWDVYDSTPVTTCPSGIDPLWSRNYYSVQGSEKISPTHGTSSQGPLFDDGMMGDYRGKSLAEVTDGTSNTFCLGEGSGRKWIGAILNGTTPWGVYHGYINWYKSSASVYTSFKNRHHRPVRAGRTTMTLHSKINDPVFLNEDSPHFCGTGMYHNVPFSSEHIGGGANFAFVDGHVQFVPETIDMTTYRQLGSINGGGVIDFSSF